LRNLLSSDSSEGEEVRGGVGKATNLIKGAAPWNKDLMVDELLIGNYVKEDKITDSDGEWYKKTDWWETAIAGCEQRAIRRKLRGKKENKVTKKILNVDKPINRSDPVI
jgi:hypothetical protein